MSEDAFWSTVRPALIGLDPQRVETGDRDGIPDVNWRDGWIELKFVEKWPVKPETVVSVPKYYQHQRVWHKRRCLAGGRCHVLIKIGSHVLLFWGDDAADHLGKVPRAELEKIALAIWGPRNKNWKRELREKIQEDREHRGPGLFDQR